jgi:hypothetical protein
METIINLNLVSPKLKEQEGKQCYVLLNNSSQKIEGILTKIHLNDEYTAVQMITVKETESNVLININVEDICELGHDKDF